MLTADQQRVKDLLRETITLLCKNGLHFQSEFQIDGLIGITLDRGDVFLVTLKETVHSGDVFVRDSKRKYPDDRNRCYEDKRRTEHRKNNVSVKSELNKDDFSNRKLEHLSIDSRQRKPSLQLRVETMAKPKNLMVLDEGNAMKGGDSVVQQHSKGFGNENTENDLPTLDEGNNSGNEGSEQEKNKTGCFSDVGQEIGLLLDSEADDKKGFQRSLSTENPDDDNGEDSDYRRNDDDEDEAYRSRRDDEDDDNDGGGSIKTDFIRKTNSHKFLSPTISSAAANNMEDNDEEPLVVKVEPPDTSYNPYPSSSQRSDLDYDGDGWSSGQHHRGHSNASQPSSSRHYQNVNEVFNNSSTSFRNAAKPFIQNASKGQQMATSMFSDNLQLHQQMLNSRQQPQQQRNNNYNELFTSLVDITQNQGFPGDEFLAGGGDFLHVASQQFPPHQQMNRLLQRRQRSTFTRTQVKCLEDVFKTVHYVDASLRMKLSRQLNLSEGTINIWFQNRRQKLKKQQQQMMMTSNSSGVPNDESLMGGGDMNPGGANPLSGDFIVNQSPGRPSNSSFSGSNAGSSPAYMQSPIHNNPPSSSAHNVQFNPMDQCPNFAFNSEPGKT